MWSWVVEGREVRPRRAWEAFWRWEQAWARRTRDMFFFSFLFFLFFFLFLGREGGGGALLAREGVGCAQGDEVVVCKRSGSLWRGSRWFK